MIFDDKKKLPPPTDIPVTIDETTLTRVKEKQILGIVIDEQFSFMSYVELTTKKCKLAYNKLILYPHLAQSVAQQLYKACIRSSLEHECIIWGYKIHQKNYIKKLENAQRGALSLILRNLHQLTQLKLNYQ